MSSKYFCLPLFDGIFKKPRKITGSFSFFGRGVSDELPKQTFLIEELFIMNEILAILKCFWRKI
jgi:hypothetical protein